MSYIMYVCPKCRKVFKINGSGKKAKCPKCTDILLCDMGVTEEEWKTFSSTRRDSIISNILDEPEMLEEVDPALESMELTDNDSFSNNDAVLAKTQKSENDHSLKRSSSNSFFGDFDEPKGLMSMQQSAYDSKTTPAENNSIQNNDIVNRNRSVQSEKQKISGLSIVSLIISFFGMLSFIGIIFGVVDLVKGDKDKKHSLSIAGIVIGSLVMLLTMIGMLGGSSGDSSTDVAKAADDKGKIESVEKENKIEEETDALGQVSDIINEVAENVADDDGLSSVISNHKIDTSVSKEYQNAIRSAYAYSDNMHMSKKGIYDQLTSEYGDGFPDDAAQYAVDNMEADWKENALKSAKNYSDSMHLSKKGVYDQLTSEYGEQFTAEEAQYAVDNVVADWKENALKSAENYSDSMHMSKKGVYDQLTSEHGEQFTAEEAQYAVDNMVADWKKNALETAKSYYEDMSMSKDAVYDQLTSEYGEQFTVEEAKYAIDNL